MKKYAEYTTGSLPNIVTFMAEAPLSSAEKKEVYVAVDTPCIAFLKANNCLKYSLFIQAGEA
jgi:hypothetical protein